MLRRSVGVVSKVSEELRIQYIVSVKGSCVGPPVGTHVHTHNAHIRRPARVACIHIQNHTDRDKAIELVMNGI